MAEPKIDDAENRYEGHISASEKNSATLCIFCNKKDHLCTSKPKKPKPKLRKASKKSLEKWQEQARNNKDSELLLKLQFHKMNDFDGFYHLPCLSVYNIKLKRSIEKDRIKSERWDEKPFKELILALRERIEVQKQVSFVLSDVLKEFKQILKTFEVSQDHINTIHQTRFRNSIQEQFQDMKFYKMRKNWIMIHSDCKEFEEDYYRKFVVPTSQQKVIFCNKCKLTKLYYCFICQKVHHHKRKLTKVTLGSKVIFWKDAKALQELKCNPELNPRGYKNQILFYNRLQEYSYNEFLNLNFSYHIICRNEYSKLKHKRLQEKHKKLLNEKGSQSTDQKNCNMVNTLSPCEDPPLDTAHIAGQLLVDDDFVDTFSEVDTEHDCTDDLTNIGPTKSGESNEQISPTENIGCGILSVKVHTAMTQLFQTLCNGDIEFKSNVQFTGHIAVKVDSHEPIHIVIDEAIGNADSSKMDTLGNIKNSKNKNQKNEWSPPTSKEFDKEECEMEYFCEAEDTETEPVSTESCFKEPITRTVTVAENYSNENYEEAKHSQTNYYALVQSSMQYSDTSGTTSLDPCHSLPISTDQKQLNHGTTCSSHTSDISSLGVNSCLSVEDKHVMTAASSSSSSLSDMRNNGIGNKETRNLLPTFSESLNTEEELFCTGCKERVNSQGQRLHTSGSKLVLPVTEFVCDICEDKFTSLKSRQAHMCKVYEQVSYSCLMCGRSYSLKCSLKVHVATHVQRLEESHSHVCHMCGNRYQTKQKLHNHLSMHEVVKRFKCTSCPSAFVSKVHLQHHIRKVHNERKIICHICGQLTAKPYFKQHLSKHTGLRPHKCYSCGDTFKDETSLKRHKYRHTFEKPFTCEICFKGFIQIRQIKMHMVIHHQRPFIKS